MARAFIVVLDSLGVGATPDAEQFGDQHANTLGHIAQWRVAQQRPLRVPHLERLGLGAAMQLASAQWPAGMRLRDGFEAAYAAARERSRGKDTPSGHWEMTGVPVDFDWGYFPATTPCFPDDMLQQWMQRCGLATTLGNCHASGTEIIERLGDSHRASGHPIIHTSADSLFQVAAHESTIAPPRLYEICQVTFELLRPYQIARVIARPFIGTTGDYQRSANRKDIALAPPRRTPLDVAADAGHEMIAIGKIGEPTAQGSDHTREHVPQLFAGPAIAGIDLGVRSSFCDLGQTLARHLGLPALTNGTALL